VNTIANCSFNNNTIHIEFDDNGMAWFRVYEIAKALGCKRIGRKAMIKQLLDFEKRKATIHKCRNVQESVLVNEYGLQRLLINISHFTNHSLLLKFQNWMFYEILPRVDRYSTFLKVRDKETLSSISELNM